MRQPIRFGKWLRRPSAGCLAIGLFCAALFAGLSSLGLMQDRELRALDMLLQWLPAEPIDPRIVIITETENDIRRYGHPLPDRILAEAIEKLEEAGTRVVGIDKYRDVPIAPGTEKLAEVLRQHTNVVWIFFVGNTKQDFITPPSVLADDPERIGFNDVVEDPDGVTRRGLLFLEANQHNYYAFPLLLALHYLAGEQISASADATGYLSLGGISLPPIDGRFGAYSQIDAKGYQIMLDYPGLPDDFTHFTLQALLDGEIAGDALRGKIVLLGSVAPSLPDYRLLPNKIRRFGVDYHAYFVSQLLHTAIGHQAPRRTWSDRNEMLWLLACCLIGAFTGMYRGCLSCLISLITVEFGLLLAATYLWLNAGWWLPIMSPLLGWLSALGLSVLYFSARTRIERRQLMQLFASHVSPEVATTLWQAREQFFSEGRVRPDTLTATVLFTDICNFTTLAENMEPLLLMNWLNEYMEEMSRLVIAHGGIVNKYIGDAVMAIFGAPVKRETETGIAADARSAVQCALDFNRRLRTLNRQWQAQSLPTITMRAGIYTGPLVAGSFGGSLRMEYTVIGDTVNIASRLESFDKTIATPDLKQPCRILIGEATYRLIGDVCQTQLVGECKLKGKHQTVNIYRLAAPAEED